MKTSLIKIKLWIVLKAMCDLLRVLPKADLKKFEKEFAKLKKRSE